MSFNLNHTHQAIGLLSSDSVFTLYNVLTLNRVWHRQLPTAAPSTVPSSVQFCESSILVGRANNTHFDLVQITVDIAVLSSIRFIAPSPSPAHLHFAQAVYDPAHAILWVTPFARGSLYGFRYALKGQPPIKRTVPGSPETLGFDKVAEFPLEPVLSFVVALKRAEEDVEIFFATPSGFSQASINKAVCGRLSEPAGPGVEKAVTASAPVRSEAPAEQMKAVTQTNSPMSKQTSKHLSPAVVKPASPVLSDAENEVQPAAEAAGSQKNGTIPEPVGDGAQGMSNENIAQLMKTVSSATDGEYARAHT